MASSADRLAVAALVALAVTGCVSTQTKAARIQLNDKRIRAAERPTRVARSGNAVAVVWAHLIRHGRSTAFVVRLRNPGPHAVSDLPISLGARGGRRVVAFLNARPTGADGYFGAHLPPIAGGTSIDWIYVTDRPVPPRSRPLVTVGPTPAIAAARASHLPAIRAAVLGRHADRATVFVRNLSAIPQYQLPVYATGARDGRLVAAGAATVPELGPGASTRLSLNLIGRPDGASLQIQAPATTFP